MIISLSREKSKVVTSPETEELLKDLAILESAGDEDLATSVFRRAIDTISFLSREKVITGTIEGGVLSLDTIPAGVSVDIRDYDVEGMEEDNLLRDEKGGTYFPAG